MQVIVQLFLKKVQRTNPSLRKMGHATPKVSAHNCFADFLSYLQSVQVEHCKKTYDDEYLAGIVFGRPRTLKNDAECTAYCRGHLTVAVRQLEKLFVEMKGDNQRLAFDALKKHREVLVDYLFDLKPIVEYLERKRDPSYIFFQGVKSYHVSTWELFLASRQLQVQGIHKSISLDHKPAQIASVSILRQAMELKFERLVGVELHDSEGKSPKLKHGFYYDFIKNNIDLYDFRFARFKLLRIIYDWTNVIVHQAVQPFAWHTSYATELCSGLFKNAKYDQGWSIYGGVQIRNKDEMQRRFAKHFVDTYGHGIWCIIPGPTEALDL